MSTFSIVILGLWTGFVLTAAALCVTRWAYRQFANFYKVI